MRRSPLLIALLIVFSIPVHGGRSSELRGILKDQEGNPVANLALSLVRAGIRQTLKSDHFGRFIAANLQSGSYSVTIESPRFKPVGEAPVVRIRPGERTFLTIVLQQVFGVDDSAPAPKNYDLKTILRSAADGRLILRSIPGTSGTPVETAALSRSSGVIEIYSGAGWTAGDFTVIPGSPYSGMLTNFAYSEDLGAGMNYAFGGQFIAGDDSLWKVRNSMRYDLGQNQSVEMVLGFSRLAFNSPHMLFVTNPAALGKDADFMNAVGTAKTLALGFKHRWSPAEQFNLAYGMEVNQLRAASSQTHYNPTVEAGWKPWRGGNLTARVLSRRSSNQDALPLPDGNFIDVSEPLQITKVGDRLQVGGSRHYELGGTQDLGSITTEFAYFVDHSNGGSAYMLMSPQGARNSLYDLIAGSTTDRGIRTGVRTGTETVTYGIDYVYGTALGVEPATTLVRSVKDAIGRHHYHAVTATVQAKIPAVHTDVTGLVRIVPGRPFSTIDFFGDTFNISNQSVNLFVRQVIPFPDVLGFSPRLEALLDLRNLLNQDVGLVHTEAGDFVLVRNPRTVRGGLSLNF
ncbi:MAG TPA: carboxypeptidase-like regulatory domain-containing protein [Acidobacteriota bacterium]